MSLERAHIDLRTLTVTFHFREWLNDGRQWKWEPRQQVLTLHSHFRIDKRRGIIDLVDNPFWNQLGLWSAADRMEPLLYKGQIKHDRGQRIDFTYEYYESEEVGDPSSVNLAEIDTVASMRLGYDVPRYSPIAKKSAVQTPENWEKKR
jgi:hypothetical protein